MRINSIPSELIDRNIAIEFSFEGKQYYGFKGDTISSALLANGVKLLGRSFKYHRPRSVMSFANHDINAMIQDDGGHTSVLNIRADVTPITQGMKLTAINTFGGLEHDKAHILNRFSKFLPVGFYYKAFHTKKLFPLWEEVFRKMTGLGKIDLNSPRIKTAKKYGFCDCLVIGAGPSGLAAAFEAANNGLDVVIVDERPAIGGSANFFDEESQAIAQLKAEVINHKNIRVLNNTYAAGYYTDNWVPLIDKKRMTKMRAKTVIVAAGAYEQPAVFRNNDLPGSMVSSAILRLLRLYAVKPMQNAVVIAGNDEAYKIAQEAQKYGVKIAAIIDLRPAEEIKGEFKAAPNYVASCIKEAIATKDEKAIIGVKIADFINNEAGEIKGEIACDGIIMAVGYAPAANLLYQAGTKMAFDENLSQFVPKELPPMVFACGRVNGHYDLNGKMLDGTIAAQKAAASLGIEVKITNIAPIETQRPNHKWPIISHEKGKNFVDFDEDLQVKDFINAAKEGFDNIELLKRYSTNGMGPSQGKHSNMNGLRLLAKILNKSPQEVGTTTARPFFHPVPMAHLGGRAFAPERFTPLHARHKELGAIFMAAGVWQRPEYYNVPLLSREEAIAKEAKNVHENVGIIDVGTLGKLEIYGKDAGEFLERVYISKYKDLKIGRARYGVMCDESGVVIDDGIIARFAEDHFYFTTTTSGAANIYRELTRLNMIWGLDCGIVNHTGALGAINIAGPKARQVLAKLTDIDLSGKEFPFMAVKSFKLAGIEVRALRVGFVGEWGYEIHAKANEIGKIWDELMGAGQEFDIAPFGVEAQRLLRLEKGHIIIGQDTDGLSTPYDAALDWAVKMDKPFFIGKRSLEIIAKKPRKNVLRGFEIIDNINNEAPQQCHLIIDNGDLAGRVTSISYSDILGKYIGLGFIAPHLSEEGTIFNIRLTDKSEIKAKIVPAIFYDPQAQNQKEVQA